MLGKIASDDCRLGWGANAGNLDSLFLCISACHIIKCDASSQLLHDVIAEYFIIRGDDFDFIKLVAHAVHDIVHDAVAYEMVDKGVKRHFTGECEGGNDENEAVDSHHNTDDIDISEDFLLENGGNRIRAAECITATQDKTDTAAIEYAEAYSREDCVALSQHKIALFKKNENVRIEQGDEKDFHNSLLAQHDEGKNEDCDAHCIVDIGIIDACKLLDDFGKTCQTAGCQPVWCQNAGDSEGCESAADKDKNKVYEQLFQLRIFNEICHI